MFDDVISKRMKPQKNGENKFFYVTIDKTAWVFYNRIVVYIANIITGGNIMYKQHIYKLFWFILVLVTIFALQACQRPDQPTLQNTEAPTSSYTDPIDSGADATQQITDPTQQATEPTQQTTDPTQPSTQPTEPTQWSHDAELTRFLTEVNHSGEYLPEGLQPPGSLTSVWAIPAADQSYVGSTVDIILAQLQQEIPFYYYYNAETDFERLAVVITAEKIPLMMILETDLNGISELCKRIAAEEVFSAKVCSATNIDFMEGNVYVGGNYYSLPEEQQLDLLSGNVTAVSGTYVGIVGSTYRQNGTLWETYNCLAMVDLSKGDLCQWLRIFERFDLEDIALGS